MKAITIATLALATTLAMPAHAKLAPVEPQRVAVIPAEDTAMTTQPLGAMLEADYFRAPAVTADGRAAPCRLQLRLFEKTRLAQSCH